MESCSHRFALARQRSNLGFVRLQGQPLNFPVQTKGYLTAFDTTGLPIQIKKLTQIQSMLYMLCLPTMVNQSDQARQPPMSCQHCIECSEPRLCEGPNKMLTAPSMKAQKMHCLLSCDSVKPQTACACSLKAAMVFFVYVCKLSSVISRIAFYYIFWADH